MAHSFRQFHIEYAGDGPEYYPLTVHQVIGLLEAAAAIRASDKTYAVNEIASIQVRLDQAIPGQMCPREINGPVAKKTTELDILYVRWIEALTGNEPDLTEDSEIVVKLLALMR